MDVTDLLGTTAVDSGQPAADHDSAPHRRGRNRDDSRDPQILQATVELLTDVGYDRLTMDAVAARAHAGKATLYRRWSSKADLVVDALACAGPGEAAHALPDTGSLRGDLEALATMRRADKGGDAVQFQIMAGLVSAMLHHADLAAAVRDRLMAPRQAALREVFERAVARGEIHPDRDLDMLTLVGPAMVFHQLIRTGGWIDEDFIARLMGEVVLPLAFAPPVAPPAAPQQTEPA